MIMIMIMIIIIIMIINQPISHYVCHSCKQPLSETKHNFVRNGHIIKIEYTA